MSIQAFSLAVSIKALSNEQMESFVETLVSKFPNVADRLANQISFAFQEQSLDEQWNEVRKLSDAFEDISV